MQFGSSNAAALQRDWRCPTCRLAVRSAAGVLPLPNNPLIVAAIQAIAAGGPNARLNEGGWRQSREDAPRYDFWSGSGGRIRVSLAINDPEQAWRVIDGFSALSLDVCASLLCGMVASPFRASSCAPRRESIRLGPAAVVQAKAYKRYGAERTDFARIIGGEIEQLLQLRFAVQNYPAFSPASRSWNRAGISRSDIALFELDSDPVLADPGECSLGIPLRLGAWTDHWLNAGGPMWISPLPEMILALDHRDNRGADVLAKKVALLFALKWGADRQSKVIKTDVRTLLRRIGELRRPSADTLQHSGRFADRFEEALFRLADRGLMEISVLGESAAMLRSQGRRWFDAWLESGVVARRPDFLDATESAHHLKAKSVSV